MLIEGLFSKQKKGLRAVMPGYINYNYRDGNLPTHTKASFKEFGILTIHGIIARNALVFMHKIRHLPNTLPISISNTVPTNIPDLGATHETNQEWQNLYGNNYYKKSVFFKGPLLAISDSNISITTLPSLFSLNIYKNSAKNFLLAQQYEGDSNEWPNFLLYNIQGLRRSTRNQ
ncbi:MAG: hypothetical protein GY820_33125 [Gammaproteobacteria bacterium]|nr:hypothetical protein [Gammaproteobacteria bacterium]